MGQYYKAINFDKGEFLSPRTFGCGVKLTESCYTRNDFVNALYGLIASDWRGDRVAFVGDYAWDYATGSYGPTDGEPWVEALLGAADRDPYADESLTDVGGRWDLVPDEGSTTLRDIASSIGLSPSSEAEAMASILSERDNLRSLACWDRFAELDEALMLSGLATRTDFRTVSKGPWGERQRAFDVLVRKPDPAPRYLANEGRGVFVDRARCPVDCFYGGAHSSVVNRTDPLTLFLAVGNGLGGGDYHYGDPPNMDLVGEWALEPLTASSEPPDGLARVDSPFDESGLFVTDPDADVIRACNRIMGSDREYADSSKVYIPLGRIARELTAPKEAPDVVARAASAAAERSSRERPSETRGKSL